MSDWVPGKYFLLMGLGAFTVMFPAEFIWPPSGSFFAIVGFIMFMFALASVVME